MKKALDTPGLSRYKGASRADGPLEIKRKELFIAKEKTPNYSPAQEQVIRDVFAAKGSALTFEDCAVIAARPDMFDADGNARKPRSIAAKISRMDDVAYKAKEPTRKDGSEIAKKADLVKAIAAGAGVSLASLDGLEKAPRETLVTLRNAVVNG